MSVEQLPPRLRLTDFIIDCPDTMALAAFYSEVTATAGGSTPVRLATACRLTVAALPGR
jgi:hypothetical protein